jgi:catechol 2,3-dioxygenase-like lactoylglutathione lyase family enzyme
VEEAVENHRSDRHVCYLVASLEGMEQRFRAAGVEILPDPRPIPGRPRFYVRDPGGNLLEIVGK